MGYILITTKCNVSIQNQEHNQDDVHYINGTNLWDSCTFVRDKNRTLYNKISNLLIYVEYSRYGIPCLLLRASTQRKLQHQDNIELVKIFNDFIKNDTDFKRTLSKSNRNGMKFTISVDPESLFHIRYST